MASSAHAPFIALAYALALAVVAALIGWTMLDHRALRRALRAFERRGIARRSAAREKERASP